MWVNIQFPPNRLIYFIISNFLERNYEIITDKISNMFNFHKLQKNEICILNTKVNCSTLYLRDYIYFTDNFEIRLTHTYFIKQQLHLSLCYNYYFFVTHIHNFRSLNGILFNISIMLCLH